MRGFLGDVARQLGTVWHHPANRGHRPRAVARAVGYQLRARVLGRSTVARLGERGRIVVRLHDTGSSQVVYGSPPNFDEMTMWQRLLGPGDLFLDVGANIGVYSLWAADLGAEVWSFEPLEEARTQLLENAALSGLDLTVFDVALGAEPGEVRFTTDLGTSNRLASDTGSDASAVVRIRTLDECLGDRRVRGAKIDVEGMERLVLEGAAGALAEARIDVMQLEWNHVSRQVLDEDRAPLRDLLRSHGYRLFRPVEARLVPVPDAESAAEGLDVFAVSPAVDVADLTQPSR